MASFSFSIRSTFGLLPKTSKIEEAKEKLVQEYEKLQEIENSEELEEYKELEELLSSKEFIDKKNEILSLDYKTTEEFQKENRFKQLKKDKRLTNYFKINDHPGYKAFIETDESDLLTEFQELEAFINSGKLEEVKQNLAVELKNEKEKQKEYQAKKKSKGIKNYYKVLNSPQLALYNDLIDSDELIEFQELEEWVASGKLAAFKEELAQKKKEEKEDKAQYDFKNTDEYQKEQQYKQLKKSKRLKDFFKFQKSSLLENFKQLNESDELKAFEALEAYISSPEYNEKLESLKFENSEAYQKLQKYKALKQNPQIKHWKKFGKSKPYQLFLEVKDSDLLKEYQELEVFVNSDEFKTFKDYMLDKDKYKKSEQFDKEQRYNELKNSENLKWYFKTKDSDKFDELKAWQLTFEDDFNEGKVSDEKWMNSYFWGKMLLNDRYVLAGDKHFYTDNKNIELNDTTLKIITKKEQTKGKVWHPVTGFNESDFDYTSGMLSTAHSFRQKYGKFEAKVKISGNYPVYQAFWLKGEKILPEIDVFKFNMDKKNRMQLSSYWGDAANASSANTETTKFGGNALSKDFFIYTLEWTPEKLSWKINDIEVHSSQQGIPEEPLYIILSAGIKKEVKGELDQVPFEIDWVRCYERTQIQN